MSPPGSPPARPSLRALSIPEYISPGNPLYSSPVESDTLPTPPTDHLPHALFLHDPALPCTAAPKPPPAPPAPPTPARAAHLFSPRFPPAHRLNACFVRTYALGSELGSGGFGFVMTATHRADGHEVAVKFIDKARVPAHAWVDDPALGRLPTEVLLLSLIDHENIVKCLDLFDDPHYFYLVQELHGSPWHSPARPAPALSPPTPCPSLLSPSSSSTLSDPPTPDTLYFASPDPPRAPLRPGFAHRPSHDLFECIEQSEHKRLPEGDARFVFAQIVDAVSYLAEQGVTHRDIKDENIVIDRELRVKLIDFGSAVVVNPEEPEPYYDLFFGTAAYAASEILRKQPYQAPPAEVWTLGVLLSYLLTGTSPFPTESDAIAGRIVLTDAGPRPSRAVLHLLSRCLDPDPTHRATIAEVRAHPWLTASAA